MITAAQLRAARALLDWSQRDLSERSKLSIPTIKRMEGSMGPERSTAVNLDAVRRTLEGAGVVFLTAGKDGGAGVRFRK